MFKKLKSLPEISKLPEISRLPEEEFFFKIDLSIEKLLKDIT